ADAIISKLQTTGNQERVDEPTLLIAADTVCHVSFSWHCCPLVKFCASLDLASSAIFKKERDVQGH
ncbi:maf-like protein, partial [Trifolium medium]|nr:maf-like protein [Trifolium medium]